MSFYWICDLTTDLVAVHEMSALSCSSILPVDMPKFPTGFKGHIFLFSMFPAQAMKEEHFCSVASLRSEESRAPPGGKGYNQFIAASA
jgi:hypothetical protein